MADLGQVFTKDVVANYMVSLFDLPKHAKIMDPCFGKGSFLDALNIHDFSNVTACEIDTTLFEENKNKYPHYILKNVDFLNLSETNAYNGIIMNPPYIRQEKIDELEGYGITKERLRCIPVFADLPSTSNMYMYFILKAIDLLKENGQLIVIFPSSWMNSKTGEEFQKLMLSKCGLEKQIHIYGEVFEREALVDVVILKLVKGKADLVAKEEHLESKNGKLVNVLMNSKGTLLSFPYSFSELATIRRGLTTGCNEMYINPVFSHDGDECLKLIISSPKSIEGYSTANAHTDKLFFPMADAISGETAEYLELWKKKILKDHKPKTLYSKVKTSEKWYELHEICGKGILFSYFVRNDMKFIMNDTDVLARDNFYIIYPKVNKWVLFALLNNYYTYYQLELSGKRYGAGLLKLQRYDIEKLTFPDFEVISEDDKKVMETLSHELVKSGDSTYVSEITKLVSKYSNMGYDEITESYFSVKASRLEVK